MENKIINYSKLPFISVVLPVRNEEKHIEECLEALINQTYPKDKIEILVVDGMSEDMTKEIVERFKIQNPKLNIFLLDNPKGHRASGLNIGIKNAKGEVIIRVDARTIIPEDYIFKCSKTLLETKADNAGGIQRVISNNNIQKAIALALSHPFGVGNAQFRLGKKSGFVDTVYLGCFKKEIFDKVGLFDEKASVISEDADINYRIKKAGGRVYLDKDIVVYYYPRESLRNLWKLYFRYGGAKAGFFLKHKVLKLRQWIPISFLFSLFFLFFLSFFNLMFLRILIIILSMYFLTDFFVSFWLSFVNRNFALFRRLLIIFPYLHFAWAFGFLKRIIQGPNYKKYWGY